MKKYRMVRSYYSHIHMRACTPGEIVTQDDFETSIRALLEKGFVVPHEVVQEEKQTNRFTPLALMLAEFLNAKNVKYGNSAQAPLRVFSKSDEYEGMRVRMDDKLSRIANRSEDDIALNDLVDLTGYLMLLLDKRGVNSQDFKDMLD